MRRHVQSDPSRVLLTMIQASTICWFVWGYMIAATAPERKHGLLKACNFSRWFGGGAQIPLVRIPSLHFGFWVQCTPQPLTYHSGMWPPFQGAMTPAPLIPWCPHLSVRFSGLPYKTWLLCRLASPTIGSKLNHRISHGVALCCLHCSFTLTKEFPLKEKPLCAQLSPGL